jgi:hypothetical protein
LKNTERIDDKLYIQHIVMLSLMHTSKISEALELGLGILSQLGEGISRNSAEDEFVEQRKRTQTMIAGVTEDDILSYRPMIDKRKQAAMKFLASFTSVQYMLQNLHCRISGNSVLSTSF